MDQWILVFFTFIQCFDTVDCLNETPPPVIL